MRRPRWAEPTEVRIRGGQVKATGFFLVSERLEPHYGELRRIRVLGRTVTVRILSVTWPEGRWEAQDVKSHDAHCRHVP